MVSSDNDKIVALKNQIITKINGLIGTHNSNSSAHSTQFQNKEDKSNKVISWNSTTTDTHYPSEKLVKDSLDSKSDSGHTHSNYLTTSVASSTYVAKETGKGLFSGSYNDLTNKPNIPTHTSDLTNDSGYLTEHQDISGKADVNDLGNTAFSNNYNDLDNLPTIPTVPTNVGAFTNDSGYLTSQDISGKANTSDLGSVAFSNDYTDLDNKPSQNIFYGTCSTSASTQTKVITCTNWSFDEGNILFVFFSNGNTYDGTTKISIKNTLKNLYSVGTNLDSRYYWKSGEVVGFIYDGNQFIMLEGGTATTTYYGITKLSDSISSTSTSLSATANAVRKAYNLANGKADEIHTHTISDVTSLQNSLNNKLEENDLLNLVYPIGSIYMSVSNVNPSTLFGGTWEAIEDKFLLSSGTTYTPTYDSDGFANKTGGEASHSLTQSEMPRHTHIQNAHNHSFNRYQNTGSTTNYSAGWSNQKLTSQNTSDTTATNQYTGGTGNAQSESNGVAHNNMPPYLVVNVWKRTA